jgi:hypothetical protein
MKPNETIVLICILAWGAVGVEMIYDSVQNARRHHLQFAHLEHGRPMTAADVDCDAEHLTITIKAGTYSGGSLRTLCPQVFAAMDGKTVFVVSSSSPECYSHNSGRIADVNADGSCTVSVDPREVLR